MADSLKSLFLYSLPIGKLFVIGLRPKWRSSFSSTCLYSIYECGGQSKSTISVRIFYGKVLGSRVKAKVAIEFFPYMPLQRMRVWKTASNRNFVWTSYGEAVGSRVKVKMAIEFFSYMPIQRQGSYCRN